MSEILFNGPQSDVCKYFWENLAQRRNDVKGKIIECAEEVSVGRAVNVAYKKALLDLHTRIKERLKERNKMMELALDAGCRYTKGFEDGRNAAIAIIDEEFKR